MVPAHCVHQEYSWNNLEKYNNLRKENFPGKINFTECDTKAGKVKYL